ncbi:MAG: hypothetical protein NTY53_18615 [Kiritimatiellaeota bacterium]|nr:hypothetical protein [Kiritimatiellota bacterium]
MSAATCYADALRDLPESGGGGCHVALLSVANLGALAGLSPEQVFQDLRAHVHGKRHVGDREIWDAIHKAFKSAKRGGTYTMPASRPALDPAKMLRGILATGNGAGEADLHDASPIRLDWEPEQDPARLLALLYAPEDRLFIGARHDGAEHVIPNPLTGAPGQTKDDKPSFRADSCVKKFHFAVLEFDKMPRATQCEFWAGALAFNWPIAALIDSGNKSIHAWLAVNAANAADWEKQVECELFARMLVPLGVDAACKNEARLSRMPGHFRAEKKRWQKIIYLNPLAGEVKQ